jgi:N-acetylglucosamine-6-phosphate deacetylase
MTSLLFHNGTIVLEDRALADGWVQVDGGRITGVWSQPHPPASAATLQWVDLEGGFLAPGFVDLHVHGGDGADFMDTTEEAFRTVCRAHARHGTTSLTPTTTVARHEQHLAFLNVCRKLKKEGTGSACILGAHY